MNTLVIKDLVQAETLEQSAMASVRGGFFGFPVSSFLSYNAATLNQSETLNSSVQKKRDEVLVTQIGKI